MFEPLVSPSHFGLSWLCFISLLFVCCWSDLGVLLPDDDTAFGLKHSLVNTHESYDLILKVVLWYQHCWKQRVCFCSLLFLKWNKKKCEKRNNNKRKCWKPLMNEGGGMVWTNMKRDQYQRWILMRILCEYWREWVYYLIVLCENCL